MRSRRVVRLAAAFALVAAGGVFAVGGAVGASRGSTVLATFSTPGAYKWQVPPLVKKVTFDVYGASGGSVSQNQILISAGGFGGEANGQFAVKPGQWYEIVVGGKGGDALSNDPGSGGFNGGGRGTEGDIGTLGGGGGGGASDIRIGGIGNPCAFAPTPNCTFPDRLIVGGGGGGGAGAGGNGFAGGGVSGQGVPSPWGGQTGGGYETGGSSYQACPSPGTFGLGGGATDCDPGTPGAGGGWYGGGVGDTTVGGGGGSGVLNALAIKGSFFTGAHAGDGEVIISTP